MAINIITLLSASVSLEGVSYPVHSDTWTVQFHILVQPHEASSHGERCAQIEYGKCFR